jgi:hypothetical protein
VVERCIHCGCVRPCDKHENPTRELIGDTDLYVMQQGHLNPTHALRGIMFTFGVYGDDEPAIGMSHAAASNLCDWLIRHGYGDFG